MKFRDLKESSNYDVQKWLEEKLELTPKQKRIFREEEILRWSKFKFYERDIYVKSFWWRLTILPFGILFLILIIMLPFNFLFTGNWNYRFKWIANWADKIGF